MGSVVFGEREKKAANNAETDRVFHSIETEFMGLL